MIRRRLDPTRTWWEAKGRTPIFNGPAPDPWPPTPGTYKPGPGTTNVRPGQVLEDVTSASGTLTINGSASGLTTITNKRFHVWPTINAALGKIKFNDCEFVGGPAATYDRALAWVNYFGPADSVVFEDCGFHPENPNYYVNAVQGRGFTVRRCEAYGTVDGWSLQGDHILIEDSWDHDLYWSVVPAAVHSDLKTHNDASQWHYGSDIEIRYSVLSGNTPAKPGGGTSCILGTMVNPALYGLQGDYRVHHNWLSGGGGVVTGGVPAVMQLYVSAVQLAAGYNITGVRVYSNIFDPLPGQVPMHISASIEVLEEHDNVLADGVTLTTPMRF